MPPDVAHWIALIAVCAAASVTQSVSGFGFGIVVVALLPLFGVPIQHVVVLVTLVVGVNIVIGLWQVRRHARWRSVVWLAVAIPFGIPVGMVVLTAGREWEWALRGLLGGVLVFAAVEPLFLRRRQAPAPATRRWGLLAGFLSGLLGGALSTGGPPIVIYVFRRQWSKEATKAAIMLLFVETVALRILVYGLRGGLLTAERLAEAAVLAPVVVVASLLGERLFHAVSPAGFRKAVATVIVVCGVYQLYRAAGLFLSAAGP